MNALEAIAARRSIRRFKDTPVPEEALQAVPTAGIQAPSGKNAQPWRFVVVRGDDRAAMVEVMRHGLTQSRARGLNLGSSEGSAQIMAEAPVTALYQDRPKRSVISHGLMVLNGVIRLVGQYRPLIFFGGVGLVLLVSGLAWGLYVVDIFGRKSELAVGYAMISVLLSILGTLALSTGIILPCMPICTSL